MDFSIIKITSKKVSKITVNILTRGITPKKVHGNNVNFGPSKLHRKNMWNERGFFDHHNYIKTSVWKQRGFFGHRNYLEKARGNDVDFSIREITSIKYMDMMWKVVKIWSSTYQCSIDIKPMSIRRGVPVGTYPSI